jgi:hypothetical protein
MNAFKIAKQVYKDFSFKVGNQHIASEYNLYYILNYSRMINAKRVLELGTGIGTVLSLFQESKKQGFFSPELYIGTEANEFCISEIKKNCLTNPASDLPVTIVEDLSKVDKNGFEFVVLDGKSEHLKYLITELLAPHAILIIEGYREDQVNEIKAILKDGKIPFLNFLRFSTWKNPDYGPFRQPFQAGHTIFFINPTEREKRLYNKLKIFSPIRSKLRKLIDLRCFKNILD